MNLEDKNIAYIENIIFLNKQNHGKDYFYMM